MRQLILAIAISCFSIAASAQALDGTYVAVNGKGALRFTGPRIVEILDGSGNVVGKAVYTTDGKAVSITAGHGEDTLSILPGGRLEGIRSVDGARLQFVKK